MKKEKIFLIMTVLMGVGFLSVVLSNMVFIFILGEVNIPLLNMTPMLLTVFLIGWYGGFILIVMLQGVN